MVELYCGEIMFGMCVSRGDGKLGTHKKKTNRKKTKKKKKRKER